MGEAMPNKWSQLEAISSRIEDLHHRRSFAEKMGRDGRVDILRREIAALLEMRNRLVDQIMTQLVDAA